MRAKYIVYFKLVGESPIDQNVRVFGYTVCVESRGNKTMDGSTKKKLIWLLQQPYVNKEFVDFVPQATVNCFLSSLSKCKGKCGTSRGVTESVCLGDCANNISSHLNSCHLS